MIEQSGESPAEHNLIQKRPKGPPKRAYIPALTARSETAITHRASLAAAQANACAAAA